MSDADLTLRILRSLEERMNNLPTRAEFEAFREDVNTRFERVDARFDTVDRRFDELERRMDNSNKHLVATDARLSTEVSAVRGAAHDNEDKQSQLDDRVTQCEHEIEELKKKP